MSHRAGCGFCPGRYTGFGTNRYKFSLPRVGDFDIDETKVWVDQDHDSNGDRGHVRQATVFDLHRAVAYD